MLCRSRVRRQLLALLLAAVTSLGALGQVRGGALDSGLVGSGGAADWLLTNRRALCGDDSAAGGGPTNKEVSRQRSMPTSQVRQIRHAREPPALSPMHSVSCSRLTWNVVWCVEGTIDSAARCTVIQHCTV